MATTTMDTTTSLMDYQSKTGWFWGIGAMLVVIILSALMISSPRNNATSDANEGNNMSNTNSGYMDTNTK